jgi:hypothetical protein
MVLEVLASNGKKSPIIFVPDSKKVSDKSYQAVLRQHVITWLSATYPGGNYVFQQDSTPAHTPFPVSNCWPLPWLHTVEDGLAAVFA